MIVEFSVGNYRSIKEIQTLSMSASPIVSKHKELDKQNVIRVNDKTSLLKCTAIYGANASGKSNLVRALVALITVVNDSVKDESVLSRVIQPFLLSSETENRPSFFQMIFISDGIQYRYGFEATSKDIVSEWLFGTPGKKEVMFFTREGMNVSVNKTQFREGIHLPELFSSGDNEIARNNSLFLTVLKALNGNLSKSLSKYLSNIIVINGLHSDILQTIAADSISESDTRKKIIDLLKIADVGIENIHRHEITRDNLPANASKDLNQEIENNKKVTITLSEHNRFNKKLEPISPTVFLMKDEAEGSKKMFELSPFIIKAMEENRPLVIDEFDARFHPVLTRALVELFNSKSNTGTQFIIATHDTNLLDAKMLRRDQICFVEKDKYGASQLYNLVEFKGVRNDASFEKDYISGRYGAIPFISDFTRLFTK